MADFNFPWELYLQAAKQKAANRQMHFQALGQALGDVGGGIGSVIQARKQQQQAMQRKQQQKEMADAIAKQYPQFAPFASGIASNPETTLPAVLKQLGTQNKPIPWAPVPGGQSEQGFPVFYNRGNPAQEMVGNVKIKPSSGSNYANVRQKQYALQDLPSNQSATTAGGAAYQVKVAARQGKALIAKATTPQAIALASSDLGRAVQRSAPLAETIGASNFANNLTTQYNLLRQKLTSDPTSQDIPKIRRAIYDMFDDLDKSATPFISNQLDEMNEGGFPISANTRKRQLGETLPDIPFIDLSNPKSTGGSDISSMSDQELQRIANGGR